MFPDFYVSESGFCFDITCTDRLINDDEDSPDYNLRDKVEQFAQRMSLYKNYYKTSNILVPMGGDFNYQAAEINFSNLDKLIKGFKDHKKYNVFYSTPSCYVQAVNDELTKNSVNLNRKLDDFFPYASDNHAFWTGYFTSRPTSKRYERQASNILQSTKQLAALAKVDGRDVDDSLNDLREAVGIMQHHDAITGTEKQAVANDYARLLTKALKKAEAPVGTTVGNLLKKDSGAEVDLKLSTCFLANVSICLVSQQDRFLVAVQNPLSRRVTHYVRLPADGDSYKITGPDGEELYDVFDSIHSFDYVEEDVKPSPKQLVFAARNLPPLGIKLYYVEKVAAPSVAYKPFKTVAQDDNYFGTEANGFGVDTTSGRLKSVTIKGKTLNITQDFLYYTGSNGNNGGSENRASGAYIFRPTQTEAIPITTDLRDFKSARGSLVDEFIQVLNDEITQIIRVYKGEDDAYVEFDWIVGDLRYVDQKGKEVITRFSVSDFSNQGTFYTDSNGREQIKRELNTRSDYDYDPSEEPVASNYYPVTSKIVIKDELKELEVAILNDRAQGGTSLNEGVVELMIHRVCTRDDGFGVAEILSEKQYGVGLYVRGQHHLTFGTTKSASEGLSTAAFERELAQRKLLQPWVLLADATGAEFDSLEKVQNVVNFKFEGLTRSLPINVQLLTLEPWKDDAYVLRFEHILEKDEDDVLSQPTTIDLAGLFASFEVRDITETTLGANQFLDDYNNEEKLIWNGIPAPPSRLEPKDLSQIELNPMQIRTFVVKVTKK
jgi:lysosomal alpha-mannosidase